MKNKTIIIICLILSAFNSKLNAQIIDVPIDTTKLVKNIKEFLYSESSAFNNTKTFGNLVNDDLSNLTIRNFSYKSVLFKYIYFHPKQDKSGYKIEGYDVKNNKTVPLEDKFEFLLNSENVLFKLYGFNKNDDLVILKKYGLNRRKVKKIIE